jgi:hypothetical protein
MHIKPEATCQAQDEAAGRSAEWQRRLLRRLTQPPQRRGRCCLVRSPKLNLQPTLPLMHTQKLPRRACGRSSTQRCATSATLTPWRRATPDSAASRRCSQSQSPTSRTTLAYLLSEDVSRRTLRAHAEAHYINASTEEAQPS